MSKLTLEKVRTIIDGETAFAQKWDDNRPEGSLADAQKPVEYWLYMMETYLMAARNSMVLNYDKTVALANLRCVLSLGEKCAMFHGLPAREDEKDIY
ncbi:MAG TPA: hypothetical protein VMU13_00830 [Candidatus Paceibacterota bacterium]|nr:hypothetical protein [Candidatus Paceibacterota bacterium]